MSKIGIKVLIVFKDDKEKEYLCSDTPYFGNAFLTITPYINPLDRILIPIEGIAEIYYSYDIIKKRTKRKNHGKRR